MTYGPILCWSDVGIPRVTVAEAVLLHSQSTLCLCPLPGRLKQSTAHWWRAKDPPGQVGCVRRGQGEGGEGEEQVKQVDDGHGEEEGSVLGEGWVQHWQCMLNSDPHPRLGLNHLPWSTCICTSD